MSDLIKHYRQLVGIAKGWAMKNLPGWSDDSHRDLLARYGAVEIEGRISASSMNVPQLDAVLGDYERRGWSRTKRTFAGNPATGSGRTEKRPVPPRIAYMVRMWGKLGTAGKVEHATRKALLAFCARQVGRDVPDLDSLSVTECQQITEAMKGWLARETSPSGGTTSHSTKPASGQVAGYPHPSPARGEGANEKGTG